MTAKVADAVTAMPVAAAVTIAAATHCCCHCCYLVQVEYVGQPLGLVLAKTLSAAREAAARVQVTYASVPAAAAAAAVVEAGGASTSSRSCPSWPGGAGGRGDGAVDVAAPRVRQVLSVPDECPPADRDGKDFWPPGWGPADGAGAAAGTSAEFAGRDQGSSRAAGRLDDAGWGADICTVAANRRYRTVESEEQLWALLGIPYRTPAERDC